MGDSENSKSGSAETEAAATPTSGPLVFISHDGRDADLAEAFSKLLKKASSGMLKSFYSSAKKGKEGINYGEEWYEKLMENLQCASDVVCLFTERSVDRPWILYEAGIARSKLNTRVLGIALGVPLDDINTGPFYHFQNCDGSEERLTDLVLQLASRVKDLAPDHGVVRGLVKEFKATADSILKKLASRDGGGEKDAAEENPMAKLVEEMKALVRDLPSRVAEQMAESGGPRRRRSFRGFHPMMVEELLHMSGEPGDPIGILLLASMLRDDVPWMYEIVMELYRAAKSGNAGAIDRELIRLHRCRDWMMHGPFMEEFGGREAHMLFRELPSILEHVLHRRIESKKPKARRRLTAKRSDE